MSRVARHRARGTKSWSLKDRRRTRRAAGPLPGVTRHGWQHASSHITELTEIQEKAVEAGVFEGSTNLLVVGPTSSGKTLVGEMAAATSSYRTNRVLVAAGVVAGAALARGTGLPSARHRIAGRDPGRGQAREVPGREVSEA